MELDAKAIKGKIKINDHIYRLKSKKGFMWLEPYINSVNKKNDGTWEISATWGPTTEKGVVDLATIKTIEQNLGKDEILLVGPNNTRKLIKSSLNENTIKLDTNQIEKIVKKVIQERENERYMFFSNLEQIRRQCGLLLNLDKDMLEEILSNGHDWAQDHIAEAKNNMDQVFDFLMNETKKDGMESSMDVMDNPDIMNEGKKKAGTKLCSRGKAAAKAKFKVYPSAYANGYAVQVCKGTKPGNDGKKRCSPPYC
jgi:hypothetical protein